jgi:hypothetical protein
MAYARIQDNIVAEIVKPVDGFSIQQCFHPDLVKNIVYCPDEVQSGWHYKPETGQFSADGIFPDLSTPETTEPEATTTEPTDTETPQP